MLTLNLCNLFFSLSLINRSSSSFFTSFLAHFLRIMTNEFENLKKKLIEKMQTIESRQKDMENLFSQLETMKEDNKNMNEDLELEKFSLGEMEKIKEEINKLISENLSKDEDLEVCREKETQEQAEKMGQIELLTQENSTIKMLNTEMSQEIETLTMLKNELEHSLASSNSTVSEVTLEAELEDTTCTICTEEMRLRKCERCRRRFHKSCVENWLQESNSCPMCRTPMN